MAKLRNKQKYSCKSCGPKFMKGERRKGKSKHSGG